MTTKRLHGKVATVTGAGTGIGRASMMQPEDVAAAILLCATLPDRTVIEEMIISPTILRDQSRDLEISRRLGEPGTAS